MQMQITLEKDAFDLFYKCKDKHTNPISSDSEFLNTVLRNFEKHTTTPKNLYSSKFMCPECEHVSNSMPEMSTHFDIQHSVESSFSCTCGTSYVRMPDFLRHYIECPIAATDLQDPGSYKRSNTIDSLKNEPMDSSSSPDNSDPECPNFYNSYRHPPVVPIKGPSNEKPFGCPRCPKGFKSKSLLEQHMHLHYPPRYKCRWCAKVYRWPPVYYHHMRTCKKIPQTKTNGHTAELKDKNTEIKINGSCSPKNLAKPVNLHSPKKEKEAISTTVLDPQLSDKLNSSNQFTCICSVTLPDLQSYFKHVAKCPHFFRPLRSKSQKPFTDSNFDHSVPEHTPIDTPRPQLLETTQPLHNQPKLFTCNVCEKEFTSKLSLKQHADGKHRAEGKYVCKTCGKRYRWGASFYYHRRTCASSSTNNLNNATGPLVLSHHIPQPSA